MNRFIEKNRKQSCKRTTTLRFEDMEDRRVMAAASVVATPQASIEVSVDGVLKIGGVDGRTDDIYISINNQNTKSTSDDLVRVLEHGNRETPVREFKLASIKSISFEGLGGADRFENLTSLPSVAYGGADSDTLLGGSAVDQFFGGDGYDYLDGRLGNDILHGEGQQDRLFGDAGDDVLRGGADLDMIYGGANDDTIHGEEGDDWIDGGSGTNKMFGGMGADKFYNFIRSRVQKSKSATNDYSALQGDTASVSFEPTFGWFDANMTDPALRCAVKLTYRDIGITRPDMITLYNQVMTDNVVSSTELTDLRRLSAPNTNVGMPEDVRNLSAKIVNSNPANANYQGQPLGDLAAGNSSAKLNQLINKWFLGLDMPEAAVATTYAMAQGSLFQNGISYTDVDQNTLDDCYILASLAETALKKPSAIQNMFVDNRDGTYAVRFFNNDVADYVTVNKRLPVYSDPSNPNYNKPYYAGIGGAYNSPSNELWVALAEKAYVQMNESGWINQDNTNRYWGINFGYATEAFQHIPGKACTFANMADTTALAVVNEFNSGKGVTFATMDSGVPSHIVPYHLYAMVGFSASTQQFQLYNPWGADAMAKNKPTYVYATWDQLKTYCVDVEFAMM